MMQFPRTNTRARRVACGLMAAVALCAPVAVHASDDPLIDGARLCTQHFPIQERNNNIPTHLLAAIATTESGRYHKKLGMNVPWPWTINVEGKGYFFQSKSEAIAQTRNFLSKGYNSIDVGCMQVNLKHHPKAFANLEQAFDPSTNVGYAAKFLRDNYATLGDWIKATAAYHSRTPHHGARYLGEIERSWNRIVAKVAAARASKSGNPQDLKVAATIAPQKPLEATVPTLAPAKKADKLPRVVNNSPAKARVIKVTDAPKSSEVVVVKAPAAPVAPVAVAETTPLQPVAATPAGSTVRSVNLDNTAPAAVPNSNAPKFVFSN